MGQVRHSLRRNPLPRQNHRSQRQSLYQQRNRLLRRLHRPRKYLVHHPYPGHRTAQRHPLLSPHPPPIPRHLRKIPRSLVPPRFLPKSPPPQKLPRPLPQQKSRPPLRPLPPTRLTEDDFPTAIFPIVIPSAARDLGFLARCRAEQSPGGAALQRCVKDKIMNRASPVSPGTRAPHTLPFRNRHTSFARWPFLRYDSSLPR
jgi:hypothetical protein